MINYDGQQNKGVAVTRIGCSAQARYLCGIKRRDMNKWIWPACALLLIGLGDACNSRRPANNQPTDSTTAVAHNPAVNDAPKRMSGRLADLGLTRDSHWRGINLGDDFVTVKAKEKGEPFESDAQHVGYTVEYPNLESMDVLYYQQGGKVSAIDVDLYLNNRPSVDTYVKELETYLTTRYGTPKPANGGTVWNGPAGEQVTLNDVSKGKDFGLKLKIAPATGTTTASRR